MKKKFFITSLFIFFVFNLIAPQVVFAKENMLSSLVHSLGNSMQRFYLRVIPGDKSAKAVINQSMLMMSELKSAHTNMELNTKLMKQDSDLANFKLIIKGPVEIRDIYHPQPVKQDVNLFGEFKINGSNMLTDLDLKMDQDNLYFKLNQFPAFLPIDLSKYQDQWFKYELASSSELGKEGSQAEVKDLTEEQKQKAAEALLKLINSSQLSAAKKDKKEETKVFVIKAILSDEAILEYFDQLTDLETDQNLTNFSREKRGQLKQLLSYSDEVELVLWIRSDNFYLTHIELPLTVDLSQMTDGRSLDSLVLLAGDQSLATAVSQADALLLDFSLDLSQFNHEIFIQVPDDAKDAREEMSHNLVEEYNFNAVNNEDASSGKDEYDVPELPYLTSEQKKLIEQYEENGSEDE